MKKQKIGIDISQLQYVNTGVGRYTRNLIFNLLKIDVQNDYTFFYNSFGNPISKLADYALLKKFENLTIKSFSFPEKILHYLMNDRHWFDIERFIGEQDLFFYSDWYCPQTKAKKISTVHDLIFQKYPQTVDPYILKTQKQRLNFLLQEKTFLLCDSQQTQTDLLAEYRYPRELTRVVYPGICVSKQDPFFCEAILEKYRLTKPFLLSVGKIEPRKNFPFLIRAFQKLNVTDLELVIVGPVGWQELRNQQGVKILNSIPDNELYALYQKAQFFVMPSLYEGFGFPALEAMALGCPTILAATSSLTEIANKASIFFDPTKEEELVFLLKKYLTNSALREPLIKEGFIQAKKFSWEKTAGEVLEIFKQLTEL